MSSNADNSGKKSSSSDTLAKESSSSEKLAKKMEPATIPSDIKRGSSAGYMRLTMSATVVKGFGRGSKLLGIPTANMAMQEIGQRVNKTQTGIYFGYTMLRGVVYQAVISIGWNPYFFDDKENIVEPHLLHKFDEDFYGEKLHLLLCGFIRNELNFKSLNDLIEAIGDDIKYARKKFEEPEVASLAVDDPFWAEVVAMENATPPESDINPSDADDVPPAASESTSSTTAAISSTSTSDSTAANPSTDKTVEKSTTEEASTNNPPPASESTSSTTAAISSTSTSDSTAANPSTDKTVEKSTTEEASTDTSRDVSGGSDGKTDGSTDGGSASTGNAQAG